MSLTSPSRISNVCSDHILLFTNVPYPVFKLPLILPTIVSSSCYFSLTVAGFEPTIFGSRVNYSIAVLPSLCLAHFKNIYISVCLLVVFYKTFFNTTTLSIETLNIMTRHYSILSTVIELSDIMLSVVVLTR